MNSNDIDSFHQYRLSTERCMGTKSTPDAVTTQVMRLIVHTQGPADWSPKWDDKKALKLLFHLRRTCLATNTMQIIANHFLLLFPFEINKYKQIAFNSYLREYQYCAKHWKCEICTAQFLPSSWLDGEMRHIHFKR